jgi:alpha-methylacyl-CoA racemase
VNYVADAGGLSLIGDDAGRPVVPINVIADYAAGSYRAVMAILVALDIRRNSAKGQFLDISLAEGVLALLNMEVANLLAYGSAPLAGQTRLTGSDACYNLYTTSDGERLSVACNEPKFFAALCEALGLPDLPARQFGDLAEQRRMRAAIQAVIATRALSDWIAALPSDLIARAPVRRLDEVLVDEHYRARSMFVDVPTALGTVEQVAPVIPVELDEPVRMRGAPERGQDTAAVLAGLGYSASEIQALYDAGTVG